MSSARHLNNKQRIFDGYDNQEISPIPNISDVANVPDEPEMSDAQNSSETGNAAIEQAFPSEALNVLFAQLQPQDVEQFYRSYQRWSLQQQLAQVNSHIAALKQKIAENSESMQQTQPSAIALATLAQLQASGVNDIDLLDRMLERGEEWLDATMQLLVRCEELDLIHGDYTQWCEHALEGAYNWIASMSENATDSTAFATAEASAAPEASVDPASMPRARITRPLSQITEELLLQKLMSDEDETIKIPSITRPLPDETVKRPATTRPLDEKVAGRPKITRPLDAEVVKRSAITRPLTESELAADNAAYADDTLEEVMLPEGEDVLSAEAIPEGTLFEDALLAEVSSLNVTPATTSPPEDMPVAESTTTIDTYDADGTDEASETISADVLFVVNTAEQTPISHAQQFAEGAYMDEAGRLGEDTLVSEDASHGDDLASPAATSNTDNDNFALYEVTSQTSIEDNQLEDASLASSENSQSKVTSQASIEDSQSREDSPQPEEGFDEEAPTEEISVVEVERIVSSVNEPLPHISEADTQEMVLPVQMAEIAAQATQPIQSARIVQTPQPALPPSSRASERAGQEEEEQKNASPSIKEIPAARGHVTLDNQQSAMSLTEQPTLQLAVKPQKRGIWSFLRRLLAWIWR